MAEQTSGHIREGRPCHPGSPSEATVEGPLAPTFSPRSGESELGAWPNQLGLLIEVNAALAGAIDAESVLGEILARLSERARLTHASIYRLSAEERVLRCVAWNGDPTAVERPTLALDGPGLVAWVARQGEAAYVPVATRDPRCQCADPSTQSEYAVPLWVGADVLGVLHIESNHPDGIRAVTRKLVDQFAAQAALAMERSELHKKLAASEERFRSIFEQGRVGVALCNLQGEFSTVNPAFAHLLGYEPEELRGRHFVDVTHPDDRAKSLDAVRRLEDRKVTHSTFEKRYLHKSGEPVWCVTVVSLIRDSTGQRAYYLGMVLDIRERKGAEEERARLQERLLQAQKMEAFGTLAGGIAHDFNNLLSVMLGFSSLIRLRLGPKDPLQEPIGMIEQSAERAAALTRQLLGFAHPGKQEMEPINIKELLERVVTIAARTFDPHIQIRTQFEPNLPCVQADPSYLEQAILNLSINARDAMPEGGTLALETSLVALGPEDALRPAHCPPGEYVRIVVRDTGVGIEPRVMQRMFEPFFTTKEPGKGTGLGLAMVYGFVQNHGGFVHVESEVGQGSEFTIHLPALPIPAAHAGENVPSRVRRGSGMVLVVDDEPLVLAFAQAALKKLGYQVLAAENGRQALEIYNQRTREIDCVLLDMVMPGISGLETCQRLRAINPQVCIIVSSGYSTSGLLQEAREAGAADFISKPYSLEGLSLTLQKNALH